MAASYDSPTEYIQHHLSFLTRPVRTGDFWTFNLDTMLTTAAIGVLAFGFMWLVTRKATTGVPSKTQAFVELAVDFVNEQVKSIYNGTTRLVAPIALTTFVLVLFMNAMDFLPVDIVAKILGGLGLHEWRIVPTADVNTTFALSLSVLALSIYFAISVKGLGGWIHELFCAPFGAHPLLWPANFLFNLVEYISKPLSHSMRLFGNMYAGEILFLLLWMWAATGLVGTAFGFLFGLGWAIFHILIVALQAYIFMMLTIVYLSMAHEHH